MWNKTCFLTIQFDDKTPIEFKLLKNTAICRFFPMESIFGIHFNLFYDTVNYKEMQTS